MKTKQLLFAILALIMFKANAQPPTAAPTPTTHAAADVISVFSNAYTDLSGTDFYPNWGQGTVVSDITVAGDDVKKYDMLDYEGTQFASNINASSMSNLHVDIWTANCTAFEFYLINTTTHAEEKVTLNPTFSGWNSYDIALSQYNAGIVSSIGQFKFQDAPMHYHSSTTVVYLDNIYFWKSASTPTITGFSIPAKYVGDAAFSLTAPTSNSNGAFTYTSSNTSVATISGSTVTIVGIGSTTITANQAADAGFGTGSTSAVLTVSYPPPTTNATAPTHLSSNVISLFSDTYSNVASINWYPNWGQSTTLTDIAVSGNNIKKYDNLNYEGVEFASALNVSSMQIFHFDIWTPNCSSLDFYFINQSPQVEQKVTVNPSNSGWNSFDIPLTSYNNIDLTKIGQFKLVGNNGSTIYLDNIYFWKSASSPTITGFSVPAKYLGDAAFTLTAPTSNSSGAFTYTSSNTSVATISGSTVTIVGIGSTTITASQADDGTYTAGSTSAILTVSYPPPPTAAPDPTRDAADVMSLFSNTYTNVSGINWFPNWGQSTVVADISIGGNTTKRYQNLNYQGVEFASNVNASAMTELHLDLWTPNCTAFDVYLINAGGTEQKVTVNPTASGWNSFDISLSQYTAINKSAIFQLKLVGTPSGTTVYLDNIYFWKATPVTLGSFTVAAKEVGDAPFALTAPTSNSSGAFTYTSSNTGVATISGSTVTIVGAGTTTITATQAANGNFGSASATASLVVTLPPLPPAPLTAAATPTTSQANVISLFSDAYNNVAGTDFFPNWGQSTQVLDTMIDGNTTKKYTNLNYQGIQFAGTIDAHEATYLHVDIWTSTCTTFDVYLINTATGAEQPYSLHPTLGGWNGYDIPLSSYSASIVNHVNQIKLVGTPFGSSKVYLDNLYFWANTCINHVSDPSVSIATTTTTVCSGSATTFTATGTNAGTAPIYQWKKNGSSYGSGSTIIFAANTLSNNDAVTCVVTRTDGCANDVTSSPITMTVKQGPAIGTTSGFTACALGTVTGIYNTNTQGGGVWSSSNTAVATVTTASNGGTGLVVSTGNGTAILTYSKTGSNGCVSTASANVVVAVPTAPNAISGTNSICKGNTTQLSSTTTGGVWSISPSTYASINSTGLVTSTNTGIAIAKYTSANASGCSASVTYTVTINTLPLTPSIQYAAGTTNPQYGAGGAFCANKTFTVAGNPTGGVWSKTGVISVTSGGVVSTGSSAGAGTLTYTYTNANGCSNSRTIAGNVVVCASRGVSGINNGQLTIDNAQFTMYPNPAKSFISLNIKNLIDAGSIVVTDLYGKTVKAQTLSLGNNTVDIANLNKGIYLVSVITANGKHTQKLVVE